MIDRWRRLGLGVIEAGWLACLIGVPLVLSPVLALTFTADKVLLFRVLTELLAVVGLLVWLKRPQFRPAPLTAALGAYALILTLATLFGRSPIQGFWGSYMRLFGLFTLLHGGILYGLVAGQFRTERQWRRLLGGVVFVSVLICCHALLQWRGWEKPVMAFLLARPDFHWFDGANETYRPFATLGNSSFLGAFLLFAIAFALGALLSLPRRRRWLAHGLLALLGFVLVINQTRGAWLAAGAMGLTFAFLTVPRQRRRGLMAGAAAIALAAAIVGLAGARSPNARWVASNPICTRLAFFFQHDRNSSGWYRLDMWRRIGTDVAASPAALLLGYGPESYQLVASRSFEPTYADGAEGAQFMDSAHNIFADTLVDAGLLGLIAFVAVLILAFRTALRALRGATSARRAVLITALSALVAYVVQGLFLFDHVVSLVYLSAVLGLIVAAGRDDWGSEHAEDEHSAGESMGLPAAPRPALRRLALTAIPLIALALPANVQIYRAQAAKRQAEEFTAAGEIAAATKRLRTACRLVPYERTYHVELASSIVSQASPTQSDAQTIRAAFRAAERELRQAVALDPGDVRTYWPLGLLYQFWGPLDRSKFAAGEEVYREAAKLSPRRQRTYWAWGELLLAQGRREEAVARYRYALALDPSVAAAQRALAGLYVRLGQPEQAEPLFAQAWRNPRAAVGAVVPLPQQAAEHESLGLAFLARGRADKARAYLGSALGLDPNRERARAALEQLSHHRTTVVGQAAAARGTSAG